jgi:hypothetical protein
MQIYGIDYHFVIISINEFKSTVSFKFMYMIEDGKTLIR